MCRSYAQTTSHSYRYCFSQDGNSALIKASQRGHSAAAEVLIEAGADLNLQNKVSGLNYVVVDKFVIVVGSTENGGSAPASYVLLTPFFNECFRSQYGRTALMEESLAGNIVIVRKLLEAGADADLVDEVSHLLAFLRFSCVIAVLLHETG
jgi:ankyrin repeat protein